MRVGQRTEVGDQIARLPDGQISSLFQISAASVCPALARKIFAFRFSENCGLTLPVPHRHKGVSRSSRTWSGMRWTRRCWRRAASTRTAKSCGPGAPMQALSPSEAVSFAKATVANAGSPRRARISRKPLRREGRLLPPVPVVIARSRKFLLRGGPGCSGHPAFPAPSILKRATDDAKLGRNAPRERERASCPRHCEERKRQGNSESHAWLWIASLTLAMTAALFEI